MPMNFDKFKGAAKKNSFTLTVIGVLLVISMLGIPMFFGGLSAADPTVPYYLKDVSTGVLNDYELLFLDDFEKDELGELPIMGYQNTHNGTNVNNITIVTGQALGYGQVMNVTKNGTLISYPKLSLNTGTSIRTGEVVFSFDVNISEMTSNAHGIQINFGWGGGNVTTHVIQLIMFDANYADIVFYGNHEIVPYEQWHHIELNYVFADQEIEFYINDTLLYTASASFTGLGWINFGFPGIDCTASAQFDNLKVEQKVSSIRPSIYTDEEPKVSIMLDDSNIHDLNVAYPILGTLPATIDVYVSAVGNSGRLTYGNIGYLYWKGWDVWSHSYYHNNMLALTEEQIEQEMQTSKEILEQNAGVKVSGFCYPYNGNNFTTDVIGWKNYRILSSEYDSDSRIDSDSPNFNIGTDGSPYYGAYRTMRMATAALYGRNCFISPYFHAIIDSDAVYYGCNITAFTWFVDLLKNNSIDVVSTSQYQEYKKCRDSVSLSGDLEELIVEFPDTYGNFVNSKVCVKINYTSVNGSMLKIHDSDGRSLSYTYDRVNNYYYVWLGEDTFTTDVFEETDIVSIVWILMFFAPILILGMFLRTYGVLFGTATMSVIFGFTMTNGMIILMIGITTSAIIALSLRGGED